MYTAPFAQRQAQASGRAYGSRRRRWKIMALIGAPVFVWFFFIRSPSPEWSAENEDAEYGPEGPPLSNSAGAEQGEQGGAPDPQWFDVRRQLNELVAASVAKTKQQRCNIGFLKTHKTGSTTLTSILYRYGARHNKTLSRFDVHGSSCTLDKAIEDVQLGKAARPEIFYYHYIWDGWFKGGEFDTIEAKYKKFMSKHAPIDFVTILREPVGHYLSFYYFYLYPNNHVDVEQYLQRKVVIKNPLCAEFGIYGPRQLDRFIQKYLPKFALVMLTERFDEGVVVMTKMFGWDPIDATYSSMLENKDGATRWDGKPLIKAPKAATLSAEARKRLGFVTELDQKLYDAAATHYEKVRLHYLDSLTQDIESFHSLQSTVQGLLIADKSLKARSWYNPEADNVFYHGPEMGSGKAAPIPF